MNLVTVEEITAAAVRIADTAVRTPLLPCDWADPDRPLWLKPENLQPIGAFKIRGAANAIARIPESARPRGVVAYSSGNHAQAVAYVAKRFGLPAAIVVPENTPAVKIEATRAHGAEVVVVPITDREIVAERLVAERGATLIPPFDHPDVIAGQGTIGLEIAADLPSVELVLVPVSGGGLASGRGDGDQGAGPVGAGDRRGAGTGRRRGGEPGGGQAGALVDGRPGADDRGRPAGGAVGADVRAPAASCSTAS